MPRTVSVPREEIVALLRQGNLSESEIARRTGISRPTVHNVRKEYGLPAPILGSRSRYTSLEDAYRQHAVPAGDGHMKWTGVVSHQGAPMARVRHRTESAFQIGFRLHHGRESEGRVTPVCGMPDCVAGAHCEDRLMRRARQRQEQQARAAQAKKPQPNGTRNEVVELLQQGLSNSEIGRRLRTSPKRVARIRAEYGLPRIVPRPALTLEQKWATFTRPAPGGHVEWIGALHEGRTPTLRYRGRSLSARRVAFGMAHSREPVGRVLPGCDHPGCVAPQHVEDQLLRNQYNAIFGAAS